MEDLGPADCRGPPPSLARRHARRLNFPSPCQRQRSVVISRCCRETRDDVGWTRKEGNGTMEQEFRNKRHCGGMKSQRRRGRLRRWRGRRWLSSDRRDSISRRELSRTHYHRPASPIPVTGAQAKSITGGRCSILPVCRHQATRKSAEAGSRRNLRSPGTFPKFSAATARQGERRRLGDDANTIVRDHEREEGDATGEESPMRCCECTASLFSGNFSPCWNRTTPQSWRPRGGGGTLGGLFKSSSMEGGANLTISPKTSPPRLC
jgi:hypothetical protein